MSMAGRLQDLMHDKLLGSDVAFGVYEAGPLNGQPEIVDVVIETLTEPLLAFLDPRDLTEKVRAFIGAIETPYSGYWHLPDDAAVALDVLRDAVGWVERPEVNDG